MTDLHPERTIWFDFGSTLFWVLVLLILSYFLYRTFITPKYQRILPTKGDIKKKSLYELDNIYRDTTQSELIRLSKMSNILRKYIAVLEVLASNQSKYDPDIVDEFAPKSLRQNHNTLTRAATIQVKLFAEQKYHFASITRSDLENSNKPDSANIMQRIYTNRFGATASSVQVYSAIREYIAK
jgi:hypothetical protein